VHAGVGRQVGWARGYVEAVAGERWNTGLAGLLGWNAALAQSRCAGG